MQESGCPHLLLRGPRKGKPCKKKLFKNTNWCRNHKHKEIINKEIINKEEKNRCTLCEAQLSFPKVETACGCCYHFTCYTLIQNMNDCINEDCIKKKVVEEDCEEECAICLEKLNGRKTKTKCNHIFHTECLKEWNQMGEYNDCPICRTKL